MVAANGSAKFLVACFSLVLSPWKSRVGTIAKRVSLVGAGYVLIALVAGHREYPHGDKMTAHKMRYALEDTGVDLSGTGDEPMEKRPVRVNRLPAEAGVYDLREATGESTYYLDGWRTPMKLAVIVTAKGGAEYLLLSAGEDQTWDTEDDFMSLKYAKRWGADRAGYGNPEPQETATPSSDAPPDSQQGGQSE